ncbi:Cobalamin-binding radical SAM protein [Desulfonema limicola]|uniref:Cobalamin-binding radical SAM protein n=1 Tax=Desulfonema limicola TaxID=45656 RepID=A0A975GJR3_9BACT|nr:radical SAM protein [Desulfonema limicola]QTA83757.1 Cobalamin-binding radical SAM protein [Desulfonema limicola]
MPDILLIQPPIQDFYLTAKRTIPYGLACIAARLIQQGFSVEIFDSLACSKSRIIELPLEMEYLNQFYGKPDISPFALFHKYRHFGYSFEHIGRIARDSKAFLIGISSLFTAYSSQALECARVVKKFYPGCYIVMGGHHPTSLPESVMECREVDFVIRGEGEAGLPELAGCLKDNGDIKNVPGIVFRDHDNIVKISEPALMADPDDYPLPAMNLVNNRFYQRKKFGSMVIISSRGCPMKCSYCSVGASYLKYRRRCVDSVIREMEHGFYNYNVRFFDFEDENLSLEKSWFLELLEKIQIKFKHWDIELRAMNGLFSPSLDKQVICAMKQAGFKTLNLSLGSASAQQLKKFRRPDVRDSVENAIGLALDCGLEVVCYIIAGALGQNPKDSIFDLLWIASKNVLAGVSVYYPSPGSADYALAKESGMLPKHFSLMRSSTLPISNTTSRLDSITLLRTGRILNFIKTLCDEEKQVLKPLPFDNKIENPGTRKSSGIKILEWFLHDGKIRGLTKEGEIYEHCISQELAEIIRISLINQIQ